MVVEVTFPDIAGFLADHLAQVFEGFTVGVQWPDKQAPLKWIFVRDDGCIRDSVATGVFSGAIVIGVRSQELREVASRVLEEIIRLQYDRESPVTSLRSQRSPVVFHDDTHGDLALISLELGVMGEQFEV